MRSETYSEAGNNGSRWTPPTPPSPGLPALRLLSPGVGEARGCHVSRTVGILADAPWKVSQSLCRSVSFLSLRLWRGPSRGADGIRLSHRLPSGRRSTRSAGFELGPRAPDGAERRVTGTAKMLRSGGACPAERRGEEGSCPSGSSPATPCSWELWAHVQAPREPSGPRPEAQLLGLQTAAFSPCPPLARVCDLIRFS